MHFWSYLKQRRKTLTSNTSSYLSGSELKTTPLEKPFPRVAVLLLFFRVMFLPQQQLNLCDVPEHEKIIWSMTETYMHIQWGEEKKELSMYEKSAPELPQQW